MRLLVFGSDEAAVKHTEWALLALGAEYQIETSSLDDAVSRWPLNGFGVGVIAGTGDLRFAEEFFMRCPRTPHSPLMVCVGEASSTEAAALLELGADDFISNQDLEELGPTKISVLLRRQRVSPKAGKRESKRLGGRGKPTTIRLPQVVQQPALRRAS